MTPNEFLSMIAQLRRERDKARHEIEGLKNKWNAAVEMAARAERERDEARAGRQAYKQLAVKHAQERDEAREELHKASVEANALATSIQKAEYSDAKEFELLGSVAGVISQIDNMYAGVRQQRDKAREQLRIAVGLLSTQPQFAIKHPEEVLAFIMEGTK
jgi:chromosome segregation ATPase